MTLDASGRLGISTTSPAYRLDLGAATGAAAANLGGVLVGANGTDVTANFAQLVLKVPYASYIGFETDGSERARIDSSGNLLVGTTSGSNRLQVKGNGTNRVFSFINGASQDVIYSCAEISQSGGESGTAANIYITKATSTSRSINAAGTVNASGADYAEYMTKAGDFTVAKGDVIGINADGKLTNVFAEAVSFCVKSTDPSYVGNDKWGCDFKDDHEGLEAARQLVDRIAFAGQVPVNVMGATPGQYIVPVSDNGVIKGIAKNEADMTLAEYMKAVGKVIAIEADGRAKIIVKVA
jgi:hypothetical protein